MKYKGFIPLLTALIYKCKSGCFCFRIKLRPI
ncbi:MAG: hypothetical protein ACJAYR_000303 [Sneathiella sp.]